MTVFEAEPITAILFNNSSDDEHAAYAKMAATTEKLAIVPVLTLLSLALGEQSYEETRSERCSQKNCLKFCVGENSEAVSI